MRILFIGDIIGKPGRRMVARHLARLQQEYTVDFTIANGENATGGAGLNRASFRELHELGIDAFTMGNHTWGHKELEQFIDQEKRIIRPGNLSAKPLPGSWYQYYKVGEKELLLINLIGRVYMQPAECPFAAFDNLLSNMEKATPYIFLDFHAEATSEKMAMAWYADGRISALAGTHTHIQTNDARVLPKGTGYVTDAGMTGPRDSILGVEKQIIIEKFLRQKSRRFEPAGGDLQFNGVLYDLAADGHCQAVELINFWETAI
ncbi:MAG: TIGR00282 family metallophosphoesterase [Clostridiales bacterium]|nr:TIGR00282 family metallophosphoesterase [Clostridiales bacterium]